MKIRYKSKQDSKDVEHDGWSIMTRKWKKTFYTYFFSQAFTLLGGAMAQFAIIWWLTEKTGSATVLAMAALAGLLPQALTGPIAGVLVDRYSRKVMIIAADILRGVAAVVLCIAFVMNLTPLWLIFVMLGIRSVGAAFHSSAKQAITPLLVPEEELLRISGFNQILNSASSIAGPVLGIAVFNLLGMEQVLLLDILGSAIACIALLLIKVPKVRNKDASSGNSNMKAELIEGITEIRKHSGLPTLIIFSTLLNLVLAPIFTLFPLMTQNQFLGGSWHASLVQGILGVGMLLGGVLLGTFFAKAKKKILLYSSVFLYGITLMTIGLLSDNGFYAFVVLCGVIGAIVSILNGTFIAHVQRIIAPEVMGRVMSLVVTLAIVATPIGLLLIGPLTDGVGFSPIFVGTGIILIVGGLVVSKQLEGVDLEV